MLTVLIALIETLYLPVTEIHFTSMTCELHRSLAAARPDKLQSSRNAAADHDHSSDHVSTHLFIEDDLSHMLSRQIFC